MLITSSHPVDNFLVSKVNHYRIFPRDTMDLLLELVTCFTRYIKFCLK